MASGGSGRQSVSPSNEEFYQSPEASQEDTIDTLLARYGGPPADRRPGEEEREEGDRGAHRNRSTVISERTTTTHVISAGSHPARQLVSPCHAVSAPTSHQSTPAREEESGAQLAVPGMTGDTRSFSWDNMASGTPSGAQG